ncbi:hypothetical protein CAPTEDRAFT_209276, partial [Capitella teleta]
MQGFSNNERLFINDMQMISRTFSVIRTPTVEWLARKQKTSGIPSISEDYFVKSKSVEKQQPHSACGAESRKKCADAFTNMGSRSLDARLNSYYEDSVAVDSWEIERMTDIYRHLKSEVRIFLQRQLPFDIGDPIDRGSSHEGLKIRRADEFDVLIPLEISGSNWSFENYALDNCFVKIVERGHDYFIPSNLRQDVYDGFTKLFSVDLVPLIKLGNTWAVAKPHPDSVGIRYSAEGVLWRRSFTHRESHYIKNISHESKKVLKIVKAMRLDNYTQMGMLPSYVYKLAFLHWYYKEEFSSSISANVISFFSYLSQVLSNETLHPYPDSEYNVNILKSFTSVSLLNVAHFIRTIILSETKLMAALRLPS